MLMLFSLYDTVVFILFWPKMVSAFQVSHYLLKNLDFYHLWLEVIGCTSRLKYRVNDFRIVKINFDRQWEFQLIFFTQFWFGLIDNFSLPPSNESDSRTVSLICSFVLLPLLVLYRTNLPFISPAYLAWNRSPKVNLNPWPCLDIWIAQMRNDCKMD